MHIRFKRALKSEKRGLTPRRLSAAKRALSRQADALPLFSKQIKAGQPTPKERIRSFDDNHAEWAQGMRDHDAERWKKARAQLRSLPKKEQEVILTFWNKSSMPANASYFATVMHNYIKQGGSLIHGR
jgi:hypothetical protein